MKSGITILKHLVDTTTRYDPYVNDLGNEVVVGYRIEKDAIRDTFTMNGYNTRRDTWKQIVANWLECGLIDRPDWDNEGYYITNRALVLLNKQAKTRELDALRTTIENQTLLHCEVVA